MDLNLNNKVILISGGAGKKGSIGETILQNLANEGAIPVVIDQSDRGYGYMEALQAKGIDSLFVKTDVTVPSEIEAAIKTVVEKYGRIDGVINNVGINDGVGLSASYEAFLDSLKLNLVSLPIILTEKKLMVQTICAQTTIHDSNFMCHTGIVIHNSYTLFSNLFLESIIHINTIFFLERKK